jgi:hypothetical protein
MTHVDVDAVADLLQSRAFPRERAREICARFFAPSSYWDVSKADREAMVALQLAVKSERADDVRALAGRMLSLVDFAD